MNRIIILLFLLLAAAIAAGVFFGKDIFLQEDKNPPKEELLQIITRDIPSLLHDNKPVIEIESISTFNDVWHVVIIKSLRSSSEKVVPVKLVVLDEQDTSRIIIGPDTHFTESELLKRNIPDSVIMELQES